MVPYRLRSPDKTIFLRPTFARYARAVAACADFRRAAREEKIRDFLEVVYLAVPQSVGDSWVIQVSKTRGSIFVSRRVGRSRPARPRGRDRRGLTEVVVGGGELRPVPTH